MPQDVKYYQPFGGEKVVFEKEETTEMKKVGAKGELRTHAEWMYRSCPSLKDLWNL